jgi:hypothetical protein
VIATEGDEVEVACVLLSDEVVGHGSRILETAIFGYLKQGNH